VTARCRSHKSITSVEYNWNGEGYQSEATYAVDSSFADKLTLQVKANDGSNDFVITLEPANFIFQANKVEQDAVYENGQKGGIVEMFGWPHADVAEECAYLAKQGWMGVKLFPVSESAFSFEWP